MRYADNAIRNTCLATNRVPDVKLIPPPGTSTTAHFQGLVIDEFPPMDFGQRLVEFLDNLFHGQPQPLLMQVESGNIDGLSPKDRRRFLTHLGAV
jgi:hypothetical protein